MSDSYKAVYYRSSQYSSLEEATRRKATSHWTETYGYSDTMDSLMNVGDMLDLLDRDLKKDLRFVWTIDGVTFPECTFSETHELLDRSYDYFSKSQDLLASSSNI